MTNRMLACAVTVAVAGAGVGCGSVQGQTLNFTYRGGTNFVGCGGVSDGPRVTHHFTTAADTHDPIGVSDGGGGFIPISNASCAFDATATPTSLALSIVGSSARGDIPPGGSGSAYSNATANDQWNFTVSQTTCFTLDYGVNVYLSTGALTAGQGVQLGVDGFGGFTLDDGSHPGIFSSNINSTGSVSAHYSGIIYAGTYFITIGGQADGNGAPRMANFNHSITLTIGAAAGGGGGPATVSPATASACPGQTVAFSVPPRAGATYQWQIETSPNVWQSLGNDPGPLPCGGGAFAYAAPINSPAVNIGIHPCAAPGAYRVRCIVTGGCGSTPSNPAVCFIDPSDIGSAGGAAGRDNAHDNNDFVAFIDAFFSSLPVADLGSPGGVLGADGLFDNNDFIVFIDQFFAAC